MTNKDSLKIDQIIPKKGRGGVRANSGRKKGTSNKLNSMSVLEEIAKRDVPFEIGLAEDYARARASDDKHLIHKYQTLILNKVLADKSEVDVTSNGETMGVQIVFATKELDDWK